MIANILKPGFPLSKFVDSFYCYQGESAGITQQLIPDGKTDLLLNFDSSIYILDSYGNKSSITKSIFQGLRKEAYTFEFGKKLNIIGIRFFPFGLSVILGIPEKEISANPVEANLIIGKKLKEIEDKVFSEPEISKKLNILEKWLLDCLLNVYEKKISLPRKLESLNLSKGLIKINEVFKDGADYKKAQRTFNEYIGISPKLYSRMLRFENIHNELRNLKTIDWMSIVTKYNFHDQSHLIKEFKFFTGVTPNEFISKIDIYV